MNNNQNLPASKANPKTCANCGKVFNRERDYTMCVAKHGGSNSKSFECPAAAHAGQMYYTRLSLLEHLHKSHPDQEAQLKVQVDARYPDPYAVQANAPQGPAQVAPAPTAPAPVVPAPVAVDQYAHLPENLRPNTDPLVAMARQALDLIAQRTDFSEARYQILDVDSDDESEMFPEIPRR